MELGALVCSPRDPACGECPLVDRCRAFALGTPTAFPLKKKKAGPQPVLAVAGLCTKPSRDGDRDLVLFAQRPDGLLGGLWELPGGDLEGLDAPEASAVEHLAEVFQSRTGIAVEVGPRLATVLHQFSHRSLTLHIYGVTAVTAHGLPDATPPVRHYTAMRWLSPETVGEEVALSTLTRKVLAAAQSNGAEAPPGPKRPRRTRPTTSLELPL